MRLKNKQVDTLLCIRLESVHDGTSHFDKPTFNIMKAPLQEHVTPENKKKSSKYANSSTTRFPLFSLEGTRSQSQLTIFQLLLFDIKA